ncbi:hypothetical protein ASD58_25665 [Duganella sp. Root1480D1]|nr:hypothetical protein ASD58_25665 [Duganella sp. Root1480D1]
MKTSSLLRGVIAAAAILASQAALAAPSWNFGYTGSLTNWSAPVTGLYRVTAVGAQGGHGTISNDSFVGGRGAQIIGSFNFNAGDNFLLAVGGMGSSYANNYNGGGGGGSFLVDDDGTALLIAGGGGGIRAYAGQNGFDASLTAFGMQGSGWGNVGAAQVKTTGLGQGGIVSSYSYGAGGAGFYSNGADDMGVDTSGGLSWLNQLVGGTGNINSYCNSVGGFGGGGSGTGCGGGGGGGGYSGGDGGFIAGGGGSWNVGFDQLAFGGVGYGNGSILIEEVSAAAAVPEPASMMLVSAGLFGLAMSRRRKVKASKQ